jgi:hypothetical protein
MTLVVDPEQAHLSALRRLADFSGKRILELGCGEGRLTIPIARDAAFVLAFDPDEEAGAAASLPASSPTSFTRSPPGRRSRSIRRRRLGDVHGHSDECSPDVERPRHRSALYSLAESP